MATVDARIARLTQEARRAIESGSLEDAARLLGALEEMGVPTETTHSLRADLQASQSKPSKAARPRWTTRAAVAGAVIALMLCIGVGSSLVSSSCGRVTSADLAGAAHPPPSGVTFPRGTIVNEKDGSILVLIPEGRAIFGSPSGAGEDDEHPQFTASLPSYYLGAHEVTNKQYREFVAATGHREPDDSYRRRSLVVPGEEWKDWDDSERSGHAVTDVSWDDASAYCAWAGLELPSELEWEKGARGTYGREYPWAGGWDGAKCSNQVDTHSPDDTGRIWDHGAGRSRDGLYQMAGNVWEWCEDWYDSDAYDRYSTGDLSPPSGGDTRVTRGGSWMDGSEDLFRYAHRGHGSATYRFNCSGFRVSKAL